MKAGVTRIGGCDGLPAQLAVLIPPHILQLWTIWVLSAAGASQVTQTEASDVMVYGGGQKVSTLLALSCCPTVSVTCQKLEGLLGHFSS